MQTPEDRSRLFCLVLEEVLLDVQGEGEKGEEKMTKRECGVAGVSD
jgi:hypothetical protein